MMNFIPIDFQIESLSCQAPLDHCFFNKHFKLVLREPRRGSGDVAQRLVTVMVPRFCEACKLQSTSLFMSHAFYELRHLQLLWSSERLYICLLMCVL